MNRVTAILAALAAGALAGGVALAQTPDTDGGATATVRPVSPLAPLTQAAPAQAPRVLRETIIHARPLPGTSGQNTLRDFRWIGNMPDDKKIDIDVDEKRVGEAVRSLVDRAKLDYEVQIDPDVTSDARVSLKAKGIRISTAMDVIAEAAGTNWGYEQKEKKTTLRLGKGARRSPMFFGDLATAHVHDVITKVVPGVPGSGTVGELRFHGKNGVDVYVPSILSESRSTFNCASCKGQTTMIRINQQPKCTKCSRVFQNDWQFCPADGSKRPAPPSDWKYCPMCGKDAPAQKSDAGLELESFYRVNVSEIAG